MKSTINLDPIIRKVNDQTPTVAGEEIIVTIDLSTRKAIEKTFLVRWLGNFQDFLVANSLNPMRTAGGTLSKYFVRDTEQDRTLALDVTVAVSCPPGNETRVAEALCSEGTPSQVFTNMLERWIREFIPMGDEAQFIDTYDSARHQLEKHLVIRADQQTGLELRAKVTLSAEGEVPREIVVGPIEIGVRLQDYQGEQKVTVEAGLALDPEYYVNAFVFQEKRDSAEETFKRCLREYFTQQVTLDQFNHQIQYPYLKALLQQALSTALRPVGRRLSFINFSNQDRDGSREFVPVTYLYKHVIPGRAEPVDINNTVQLYCENSAIFKASGIADLEAWTKSSLEIVLRRHLIGKTYVDLLLRFAELEQLIKRELSARAAVVGYKVDHLVSLPKLKEIELKDAFTLDLDDTFETELDGFEVQLKFSIKLRIPNLQAIEKYLNWGRDVKEAIKDVVHNEARQCLRSVHPERFYLYFNHAIESSSQDLSDDGRMAVKDLLTKRITDSLVAKFRAEISYVLPRVGSTKLTERYNNLCYVIRQFRVSIETPDPHGTESLVLTGNFELRGVYSDSAGWQRFSALRLDLDGLQAQLETHLKAELKTFYQSSFMFQNSIGREQVFKLVRTYAGNYMRQEFGLIIHLTNLDRNATEVEGHQRQFLIELENDKLAALTEQSQRIVDNLKLLRTKRLNILSVFPIDKETLEETDESIKLLEAELEAVTMIRYGDHRVGHRLEQQIPDELPQLDETVHVAIQPEAQPAYKRELGD
jgi:hypothetical protein